MRSRASRHRWTVDPMLSSSLSAGMTMVSKEAERVLFTVFLAGSVARSAASTPELAMTEPALNVLGIATFSPLKNGKPSGLGFQGNRKNATSNRPETPLTLRDAPGKVRHYGDKCFMT